MMIMMIMIWMCWCLYFFCYIYIKYELVLQFILYQLYYYCVGAACCILVVHGMVIVVSRMCIRIGGREKRETTTEKRTWLVVLGLSFVEGMLESRASLQAFGDVWGDEAQEEKKEKRENPRRMKKKKKIECRDVRERERGWFDVLCQAGGGKKDWGKMEFEKTGET